LLKSFEEQLFLVEDRWEGALTAGTSVATRAADLLGKVKDVAAAHRSNTKAASALGSSGTGPAAESASERAPRLMEPVYEAKYALLAEHLLERPLRCRIATDLSAAMLHLHTRDPPIFHQDLKSPNVLIESLDASAPVVVKLADFGVSTRLFAGEGITPEAREREVENPIWSAPELLVEGAAYGLPADVYSFGIVMCELFTRARPFGEFI
jgi:hypothetical protein